MKCSAEGCERPAVVSLHFAGQPGHVHVCSFDEAVDREFCDVTRSTPFFAGRCVEPCTPEPIYVTEPTELSA